jgi:hypothetical protein
MTSPKLGFRGLIVASTHDDAQSGLPAVFRLGAPKSAEAGLLAERETASSEDQEAHDAARWLLETAGGSVHPNLLAYAAEEMMKPEHAEAELRAGAVTVPITPPPGVRSSSYNPEYWNDSRVQPFNNCYNFATNFRSDTTAQPGRISGAHYTEFSCWNVGMAASYDGVGTICQAVSNLVALVIWPGVDFHWYRLQADGFWAHKIGHGSATNLDSGGNVIEGERTPENCGRGPYTLFCGYRFSPVGIHVV